MNSQFSFPDLFSLKDKIALVTGSGQGLGLAIASGLASAGASLILNGRDKEKLRKTAEELSKDFLHVYAQAFDVTDEPAVIDALNQIEEKHGVIDILVNNAGIIKRSPAVDMSLKDWEEVIRMDLTGPFIMSKHVAKRMIRRGSGGKIINICSMMSEIGRSTVDAYAAAKGGLKMLTKNLATEWAKYYIQVNGIGPGYFATELTAPIRKAGHPFNEFILRRTPAGRWGNPEDLIGAAIFLASRASDFVNGHILYVDGGILASLGRAEGEE
jgi:gluconate 5-dehydrogenase